MANESSPYSDDAQIFTFGVHGTDNKPDHVLGVASQISEAIGDTTSGANLFDNTFSWEDRSGLANQTPDRMAASKELSAHILQQIDSQIEAGKLDPSKPLTINIVGFSHGGNVAILASDEISEGLKQRGLDSAIHLTTLSTPAYTFGDENPDLAAQLVRQDGVQFAHTHFSVAGDSVIRGAIGNSNYDTEVTTNINMNTIDGREGVDWVDWRTAFEGIDNHGAPQDHAPHMIAISEAMRLRFEQLAAAQNQSHDGGLGPTTASPSSTASSVAPWAASMDWDSFNSNPLVQQTSAALLRAAPGVPQKDQNPSLIAGLVTAAAENKLPVVQDVAFSNDGKTAFVIDRDRQDPAARIVPVSMEVANIPIDQAWSNALRSMDVAQKNQVPDEEQPQKKIAPAMT